MTHVKENGEEGHSMCSRSNLGGGAGKQLGGVNISRDEVSEFDDPGTLSQVEEEEVGLVPVDVK